MRFGSVCSGIEAASVAWHPLGWQAAWLAEIEPFPSAVLKHHYPTVPNLGDMTALPCRIASGEIEAPDLFCGGTPCQAFSVAGLRQSLDDARGNLSLVFCEIANAIDDARAVRREPPAVVFWENVPGVLSTKDNAFGCFLAGLAGEDDPLIAPGGKWSNAGCVFGPSRTVAWRILDAQYFGVAQRRRRVFVVASARTDFDPVAVLFEFDGVRRDTAPSREAGQSIAPSVTAGAPNGGASHGARSGSAKEGLIVPITMAHGQGGAEIGFDRGPTLTCNHEAPIAAYVTHSPRGEGFDASEDGTGRGDMGDLVSALNAQSGETGKGDAAPCVAVQPIAFQSVDHAADATVNLSPTMRAHDPMAVAVQASQSGVRFNDTVGTLDANYGSRRHNGVMQAMQVRRLTPVECERLQGFSDNYTAIPWRGKPADQCPDGPRYKALGNSWAVPNVAWIGRRIQAQLEMGDA